MDMNYPIIKIPGFPRILKNNIQTKCSNMSKQQWEAHKKKHGANAKRCKKFPDLSSKIKEDERSAISRVIRHQWGRPMITGPVEVSMLFKIPAYHGHNKCDLSNARQLYEDLLQEQIEEWDTTIYKQIIKRVGSDVIKDDKQIQCLGGTKFFYLCEHCPSGETGKRSKSKKWGYVCPGPTKCKYAEIEIWIKDWEYPEYTPEQVDYFFGR
jgi:hypothetical protein